MGSSFAPLSDVPKLIEDLGPHAWGFKLHASAVIRFFRAGIDIAEHAKAHGGLFVDLNGHDISSEVAQFMRDLDVLDADYVSMHASGGLRMLQAATSDRSVEACVLAITILTHLTEEECQLIYGMPIKAKVLQFATWAQIAGCSGVVCSPKELTFLKQFSLLDDLERVVPGIRPEWYVKDKGEDQARVATPASAIADGADLIVVGRPIMNADDPMEALKRTNEEIQEALAERDKDAASED